MIRCAQGSDRRHGGKCKEPTRLARGKIRLEGVYASEVYGTGHLRKYREKRMKGMT